MEERSQGEIPATTPFLSDSLRAVTRLIRNECRWHVAEVTAGVHRARGVREVWLRSGLVVGLTSVLVDGVAVDPAGVDFDPETGWVGVRGGSVVIEFEHGHAEVPADLVDLTLMVAARSLGSPLGLVREQAGAVSVTHATVAPGVAGGLVLLEHEREALAAYRVGWLP